MIDAELIKWLVDTGGYYFGPVVGLGAFWFVSLVVSFGAGYVVSRLVHRDRIENLSKGDVEKAARIEDLEKERDTQRKKSETIKNVASIAAFQWLVAEKDFILVSLIKDYLSQYSANKSSKPETVNRLRRVLSDTESEIKKILENAATRAVELVSEGASERQEVDDKKLKVLEERFEGVLEELRRKTRAD